MLFVKEDLMEIEDVVFRNGISSNDNIDFGVLGINFNEIMQIDDLDNKLFIDLIVGALNGNLKEGYIENEVQIVLLFIGKGGRYNVMNVIEVVVNYFDDI